MSRHIIHKQKVILNIPDAEQGHLLQDKVSHMLHNGLALSIERILDEAASADEVIRIERLELDLDVISIQNFDHEFKDKLITELGKAISKIKNNEGDNGTIKIAKSQSLLQSLLHFLAYGFLPWYEDVKKILVWEAEILRTFTSQDWRYFSQWLQDNNSGDNQVYQRLILQFSDNFLKQIFLKANLYDSESFGDVYEDLFFLINTLQGKGASLTRDMVWKAIFDVLLEKDKTLKADPEYNILRQYFYELNVDTRNVVISGKTEVAGKLRSREVKMAFAKLVDALEKGYPDDGNGAGGERNDSFEESNAADEHLAKNARERLENSIAETDRLGKSQKQKSVKPKIPEDGLYAENCGIAILHPFLEMFFVELGLAAEKKFIDDDARKRAVLLLHYLATGEAEVAEFNLALQKILCNVAIEETMPSSIELTDKEIVETEKLLHAVIGYWPPLRNTSIDGLRSSFLQREGKLVQIESGWCLNMEKKTLDILLGKLPWGFSTIQLPWMKHILSVEWC